MNFSKLMRSSPPPPPMEPPPPHAERASLTSAAPVVPIGTSTLMLQEITSLALHDQPPSPSRRTSSSPVLRRVASDMTAFNSAPSASTPKATNRASIQVVTPPSEPVARRLTRTPSISVPNLDRTQFGKDSELVLLIDQLKADLARSQQEVTKLQKKLMDRAQGVDEEKVAVEHTRYLEEKVRHLEAENVRLKQHAQRHQLHDADKRRLVELESAMHDAKRAEVRALELVVATIGKDRLDALLNNPALADLTLEDRLAAASSTSASRSKGSKHYKTPSSSVGNSSDRGGRSTSASHLNDVDALDARSKQLDVLWKQHCRDMQVTSTFDRSLRR
ncbi:hypothetical protein H257_01237 [Aphanomyces astaci]|uniref:Uncharacterized protein n=1 Tax=Aphanomyces astaci TaxID=112090 RepID=W4H7B5_APHAT|nr:hypothetical protein H257_01237 [Aphanomyces astaci]ETV87777.1 hypothetical protein H257_01237 [Aphanomyces astaci]|eukprot:XP_009822640.1 hypothetical protein H257_01237 [Aphanomyces astaci]